jgi:mycoredoxin
LPLHGPVLAVEEWPPSASLGWYPDWAGRQREGDAVGRGRDEVVIYWRPDCVFCLGLLLRLRRTRLRYRRVDIREDPGAKAFVRSVADGNETVPTVGVAGRALVNPSKREVLGAVRAYAPHALGDGC